MPGGSLAPVLCANALANTIMSDISVIIKCSSFKAKCYITLDNTQQSFGSLF